MTRDMKESGLNGIGKVPEHWEIKKVKKLFSIGRGRVIAKTELKEEGIYPVYSSQTKNDGRLGFIDTYDYDKPQLTWTTDGANAGTVFLRRGEYNCTNVCGTLLPKEDANDLAFLKYVLEHVAIYHKRADINGYKIMSNEMANIEIPLPKKNEQLKIVEFLNRKISRIDSILEDTKQSIFELKKYKQSLITKTVIKGLHPITEMKNSKIKWIGEIPSNWKESSLKQVCSKITDGAHVSPEEINGKYKFVSVKDINEDEIDFENALLTSEESYNQLVKNGCKPLPMDVLISKDGTVGKSVVINYEKEFVVASSLIIATPNILMDSYYLNYLIKSNLVQQQLNMDMKGSALKRVSIEKVRSLKILFPPIEEQRELIKFLDTKCPHIDSLIEQKKQLLIELETYKKSLIYEYVTGKKEVL